MPNNKQKYQRYKNNYTRETYAQICARFRKDDPVDMSAFNYIRAYGVKNFMRTAYTVLRQLDIKEETKDVNI